MNLAKKNTCGQHGQVGQLGHVEPKQTTHHQLGNEKRTANIAKFTTFANMDAEKIDLETVTNHRE